MGREQRLTIEEISARVEKSIRQQTQLAALLDSFARAVFPTQYDPNKLPIVPAQRLRRADHFLRVICPFCHAAHFHSSAEGNGVRAGFCGGGSYVTIEIAADRLPALAR